MRIGESRNGNYQELAPGVLEKLKEGLKWYVDNKLDKREVHGGGGPRTREAREEQFMIAAMVLLAFLENGNQAMTEHELREWMLQQDDEVMQRAGGKVGEVESFGPEKYAERIWQVHFGLTGKQTVNLARYVDEILEVISEEAPGWDSHIKFRFWSLDRNNQRTPRQWKIFQVVSGSGVLEESRGVNLT